MGGTLYDFLAMGGYAAFVWPSYALVALVMIGLFVGSWRELKRRRRLLEQLQAAAPHRRRGSPDLDAAQGEA